MRFEDYSNISSKAKLEYWSKKDFYIIAAFLIICNIPIIFHNAYMFYIERDNLITIEKILIAIGGSVFIYRKRLNFKNDRLLLVAILYLSSVFVLSTAGVRGLDMICLILAIACGCVLICVMCKKYNDLEKQTQFINKSKELLIENEKKHKAMITNISGFIAIVDKNAIVKYISPNIEKRSSWKIEDLLNKSPWEKIHIDDREMVKREFKAILKKDGLERRIEARFISKDGMIRQIELIGTNLINDPNINGILINTYDITEHKMREEKILYLNYHDVLTGVYNRRFFEIQKECLDDENQLPLSVIVGDINGLKVINESLGHTEGDKHLRRIANILECCCSKDDTVARIGGDEFSILLPKTSREKVYEIVKKINMACEEYNKNVASEVYYASISLGCATKTNINESFEGIEKVARECMYKRKLLDTRSSRSAVISSMKTALYEKSQKTEEHSERIVELSKAVGQVIGLSVHQFDELELLASLHDIGKIGIDDNILNKPGKLTDEEWVEMKKHSEIGYRIAMASPELMPIAECILAHHERFDGAGYPQGLSGENIPILSRIISVVDSYDAMIEDRPYRKGLSKEIAINEIIKNAGKQFDPDIARVFVEIISHQCL